MYSGSPYSGRSLSEMAEPSLSHCRSIYGKLRKDNSTLIQVTGYLVKQPKRSLYETKIICKNCINTSTLL